MKITIYTKQGCPWCKGVLDLFEEEEIEFEEKEVLSNPDFFKEMIEKSGQSKAPVVEIDGHIIADTDREAVAEYLESVLEG